MDLCENPSRATVSEIFGAARLAPTFKVTLITFLLHSDARFELHWINLTMPTHLKVLTVMYHKVWDNYIFKCLVKIMK